MQVSLALTGEIDETGKLKGYDLTDIKSMFRDHLNESYDHRFLVNSRDPLVNGLELHQAQRLYPGINFCAGDPTTENICSYIWSWAILAFPEIDIIDVNIAETGTNGASYFGTREDVASDPEVSSLRDLRANVSGGGSIDGAESSVPEAERVQPPL